MSSITVSIHSFKFPANVPEYEWTPLHHRDEFGILFSWQKTVPENATRIGMHLMYPGSAIEFAGNVSITALDHRGEVVPESLTSYAVCMPAKNQHIVAILNINAGDKRYSDVYVRRFAHDAGPDEKGGSSPTYSANAKRCIKGVFGITSDDTDVIAKAVVWSYVPNVNIRVSGWHIDGIIATHDIRFGVVNPRGVPFRFTASEIRRSELLAANANKKSDEVAAKAAEIAAKNLEIAALADKNRTLVEKNRVLADRLEKMKIAGGRLAGLLDGTAD